MESNHFKVDLKVDNEIPLSKKQLKKQKKIEMRARKKTERVKKKKTKRKTKDLISSQEKSRKALKDNTMQNSKCKLKVAIDCSFDHLMSDNDIKKLVQQLQYCYSSNRRTENPLQLYMTSIGGKTKERLDNFTSYQNWDVNVINECYKDIFDEKKIVYLTSESPNILSNIDDQNIYIIGGLVDHNHHKGLCYKLAEEGKMNHAKLPIDEYVKLSTRKVLAINHVFEILIHYSKTKNWADAFECTIPKRKVISSINSNDASSTNGNEFLNNQPPHQQEHFQKDQIHDKKDTNLLNNDNSIICHNIENIISDSTE